MNLNTQEVTQLGRGKRASKRILRYGPLTHTVFKGNFGQVEKREILREILRNGVEETTQEKHEGHLV